MHDQILFKCYTTIPNPKDCYLVREGDYVTGYYKKGDKCPAFRVNLKALSKLDIKGATQ